MANLKFIEQVNRCKNKKIIIDFSDFNGVKIEYTISDSIIQRLKEIEKNINANLKETLANQKIDFSKINDLKDVTNDIINGIMENTNIDELIAKTQENEFLKKEAFVFGFENSPDKQEFLKWLEEQTGDLYNTVYKRFVEACWEEFERELKKIALPL